jgi:hypothetical protein
VASPPSRPTFTLDADAGELTISVTGTATKLGWEQLLVELERYLPSVDIVILDGTAWDSAPGQRVELLLRERLPAQGVPVLHQGDARLAAWRASGPRRPPRRRRAPSAW